MALSPFYVFDKLPRMVRKDNGLSFGERILYSTYVSYAREKGECYPGIKTLAEELGVHPRTVKDLKSGLVQAGLIESIGRFHRRSLVRIVPLEDVYQSDGVRRSREEIDTMHQDVLGMDEQDRTLRRKGDVTHAPKKKSEGTVVEVDPVSGNPVVKEKPISEYAEKKRKHKSVLIGLITDWRAKYERVFGIENMSKAITNADLDHMLHIFERLSKSRNETWNLLEYAIEHWQEIRREFSFTKNIEIPTLRLVDALKETLEYVMKSGKRIGSSTSGSGVHRADDADKMMEEYDRKLAEIRAQHAGEIKDR